ncbi:MAG: Txe/YoeB family addiction module toxin [Chloroflexota bacterium]|nr:Txe/YoeB family addiction module toxin [Chloroflexota bacterium]
MARNLTFTDRAWSDYRWWQDNDPATLKRLNVLIRECQRTPFAGTGKPEPLKINLKGFWSRRITKADRLVYRASSGALEIVACRFHYGER